MLRRRHDDFVSANRLQISIDDCYYAADDHSQLFEELPPRGLIRGKKFSLRPSLADAWLVRRPANFEGPVGTTPNERCAVTEG